MSEPKKYATLQREFLVEVDGKIETKGAQRVLFENVGLTDCNIGIWGSDNCIKSIPKKPDEAPGYARGTEALEGTEFLNYDHEVKFATGAGSLIVTIFTKVPVENYSNPEEIVP